MSLFTSKEWWRTECGANESFDGRSLSVAPLFGTDTKDVVIVGSHTGYLRIYNPSSKWTEETKAPTGYRATDLIIETQLADCIVDSKVGKFVTGSQDLRLAVLAPKKLVVYSAVLSQGSTEHGDRCLLSPVYEHALPRFPSSLVVGPFGGVRNRDFLCVQCLDGTLLFYEQETFTFAQNLMNRLLPTPLLYISRNDVFVTLSSARILECYRYQNIAEFSRNEEKRTQQQQQQQQQTEVTGRNLEPDWSYNLGEDIVDMNIVTLSSFEVGIVVLGERNLFCLRDSCTLKYAKRLEYHALCFHAYVIEPDGKLMVLVVAETNTLMIYEGTSLRWSAQLSISPIAVVRANFQHLEGAIVALSDEGRLEVCYLGSEPSMFVAPPPNKRGFDYEEAERTILRLRDLYHRKASSGEPLSNVAAETELVVTASVSPHLESFPFDDGSNDDTEKRSMCRITVELTPYAPLQDVQIFLDASRPFVFARDRHVIPNLCDRHVLQTTIYTSDKLSPVSSEARITATYSTGGGFPRVLRKSVQIPLRMMVDPCPPENTASFATTVKSAEPVVNFGQLFPEFIGETALRQSPNALGLRHIGTGSVVTIVAGATTNRYRVHSNDGPAVAPVVHQLLLRLGDRTTGGLGSSVGQHHLQLVHSQIETHFACRQRVRKITNEIALLTTQLRNIERRMLRNFRERSGRSLATLSTLLDDTYGATFSLLDDLAAARAERERAGHGLQCALRLLLLLLRLNASDDKYALLESAIGFEAQLRDDVGWEETADVALAALLRVTSRKSDVDPSGAPTRPAVTWNRLETTKDVAKLKKRLVHAVERLNRNSDVAERESG